MMRTVKGFLYSYFFIMWLNRFNVDRIKFRSVKMYGCFDLYSSKPYLKIFYRTDPEVIKPFSYSAQLSTKFILLINVNMQTIVSILTFISRINTTSERLKAISVFTFGDFSFYEQLKFRAQFS